MCSVCIWNYIMWLEEACCGSSDLQGKGAVIIEFILDIFRDYPVKRSHFSHDAYILDTSKLSYGTFKIDRWGSSSIRLAAAI